jgi:ribokinase
MTLLVAGSSNLDFVVRAEHIPAPGETVLGGSFQTFAGGKGANQAVAAARAGGAPTRFLTVMGRDLHAQPIEASLHSAGVEIALVRSQDLSTGVAFICVDDAGQNAITVAPGANLSLSPQHLPELEGVSHLLMQLEIPLQTVQAYALAAKTQGVCVVLNAAPAQELPAALLKSIDVLVVNEGELRSIAGHELSIAQCMQRVGIATVIVTLGEKGCCAWHGGSYLYQPSFDVTPVDTTGAGDTFCGVLVAALSQGQGYAAALQRASAAGALACTRAGAQSSIPSAREVDDFWALHGAALASDTEALHAYCTSIMA